MASDDGRRVEERVTINQEFESLDAFAQEYVTNISISGAFIKCREPLPVGTKVNFRFAILADDIEVIEGFGEVVRAQNDPPGMGVVFESLSERSAELIRALLAQRR